MGMEDEEGVGVGVAALLEDGVITVCWPPPDAVAMSWSFKTSLGI